MTANNPPSGKNNALLSAFEVRQISVFDADLVSNRQAKAWVIFTGLFMCGLLAIYIFVAPNQFSGDVRVLATNQDIFKPNGEPVSLLKTGAISSSKKSSASLSPGSVIFGQPSIDANMGVTILSRSRETVSETQPKLVIAPTAQGADRGNGFAISLGNAQAFDTLSKRFRRVAALNSALFKTLEPRAILVETQTGLSAKLVAGPFASAKEASRACEIIKLPRGVNCGSEIFDGDLISRQ